MIHETMTPTSLPPPHLALPGDFGGADLTPERYVVELEPPVRRDLQRLAAHETSGTKRHLLRPYLDDTTPRFSAQELGR
ncbi:MAG: hypothetical protein IPK71_11425 [Myxococcales bacterium]|nr:hypothetical protein [Myxococcales bacterium]